MKFYLQITILYILLISCSKDNNRFENIEVMTYSWAYGSQENNSKDNFYIHCSTFSTIDKNGKSITYKNQLYPSKAKYLFSSKLSNSTVDSLILISHEINDGDFGRKIYNGPCMRIKINFANNTSKTFSYPMIMKNKNSDFFEKLYHEFENPKTITILKGQNELLEKRKIFIKTAMRLDTLKFPLSPLRISSIDK